MEEHDFIGEDSEAFSRLGQTIFNSQPAPERAVPVEMSPTELENISFPGEQHSGEVQSAMENVIRAQRDWNTTSKDLFWAMAIELIQHRHELEHIRSHLERARL